MSHANRKIPKMMVHSDRIVVIEVDKTGETTAENIKALDLRIPYISCRDADLSAILEFAYDDRDQVIICGECGSAGVTHACYCLLQRGYHVFLIVDAANPHCVLSLRRLTNHGVVAISPAACLSELTYLGAMPQDLQ